MGSDPERVEQLREMGRLIRAARKARGHSLRSVASGRGVSAGYLSLIERGHRVPSISLLAALGTWYQTDPTPWIRLAHPEKRLTSVRMEGLSPTPEPRPLAWSYENAINDPTFSYTREIQKIGVNVPVFGQEFIGELYEAIWELDLQPKNVDALFEEATQDPDFQHGGSARSGPPLAFEAKRAIAELYLYYRRKKERNARLLGKQGDEKP